MSLSRAEMNQLRGLMSRLTVAPPPSKKKNKKKKGKKPANIPAGISRGTNAAGTAPDNGSVTVSRTELLGPVTIQAGSTVSGAYHLLPTAANISWLHKLSAAFDRIEWLSATLHWKPFVGTNSSGSIAFGVEWGQDVAISSVTRSKVQACTPVYESPVWQSGKLSLPQRFLMTRRVYLLNSTDSLDTMPGTIVYALVGAEKQVSVGEIWITYRVRLSGTSA